MDEIVVGIDVGTTKICTLVGRVEGKHVIRVLGVGIEPSEGVRKGNIVDLNAATQAIRRSVQRAEQTSGLEITSALVSLAGVHVSSVNSRGMAPIVGGVVDEIDVYNALDAARAIAIPPDREIIHVIQRGFSIDGQEGIRHPIGMHGYKLEVEAHIITASAATVDNLRHCVQSAGVQEMQFVLNPLAAGEVTLTDQEREMGVAVCDIGGGTTDLALYVDGEVWHTMVLGVGGNHITQDISHGLRLPLAQAEEVKKQQGYAFRSAVRPEEYFTIHPFGEDHPVQVSRYDLAYIIEARVSEIFQLIHQEIKRSGYDGLLPAGLVLTGGTALLPGIQQLASEVMGLPVRTAQPESLLGMVDRLHSPAFSTSVGLLYWGLHLVQSGAGFSRRRGRHGRGEWTMLDAIKDWLKRLLP